MDSADGPATRCPPRWADVLPRAFRGRCPVCGEGRIFPKGWRHADVCESCGWRLIRGPGHWVGGNEINVIVTYPFCVLAMMAPAVAIGPSFAAAAVGGVVALAMGLAIHRPARSLFFAIDYMIDPNPDLSAGDEGSDDPDSGGDGRDGGGTRAPDRGPGGGAADSRIEVPVVPVPTPRPDPEPVRQVPAPHPVTRRA